VSKSCFDPTSPNVAWLDKNTLQDKVNLKNDNQLNVLFFGFTNPTAGQASMPWSVPGGPLSIRGGAIIDLRQIGGKMFRTLPHELGHSLGLYHTFEDWFGCDDPCFEFTASFGKGDLVEDTPPDYKNGCSPPKAGKCGKKRWSPAPLLTNMMSYHAGCTDLKDQKFTKGQFARMHCYLDLMMSPWTTQQKPSFVPLAPRVMPGSTASSIRLSWIRPMKFTTGKGAGGGECMHCSASGALLQYAIAAKTAGYVQNNPPTDKVLGPPDQKVQCKEGFTALGPLGCHTECPTSRDIFIDVTFEVAVVPAQVTVYLETGSDPVEVVITYTDGSKQDLGVLTGSCSTPPTKTFNAAGKTTKSLRVTLRAISKWTARGTAIDAVSLISATKDKACQSCPTISYQVERDGVVLGTTNHRAFEDKTAATGKSHKYRARGISSLSGAKEPAWSPALSYTPGGPFCGDGKVDSGEQCDDANGADGDGCSLDCKLEAGYLCSPSTATGSICKKSCGDGVCEAAEKFSCPLDCGIYSDPQYFYQWVSTAQFSAKATNTPALVGPPNAAAAACTRSTSSEVFTAHEEGTVTVTFKTAVPMTSSSAVEVYLSNQRANFVVELIDTTGRVHKLPTPPFAASCTEHPWRILFSPDLSDTALEAPSRHVAAPQSFSVTHDPAVIKKVRIKIAHPSNQPGLNWSRDGPQITGMRLVTKLSVLQGMCALQGTERVWSTPQAACVTATPATLQCPASRPLSTESGCYKAGFCSSNSLATCRSSCKWGSLSGDVTPFKISMEVSGVNSGQLSALKSQLIASIAESVQLPAAKVSVSDMKPSKSQLNVVVALLMPNDAALKAVQKSIATLLVSTTLEASFKSKALGSGKYIPSFRVLRADKWHPPSRSPTSAPSHAPSRSPTSAPSRAPSKAPTPAATVFCQVGSIDASGSCICADKSSCKGTGCTTWSAGSYYTKWDENAECIQSGSAPAPAPAPAAKPVAKPAAAKPVANPGTTATKGNYCEVGSLDSIGNCHCGGYNACTGKGCTRDGDAVSWGMSWYTKYSFVKGAVCVQTPSILASTDPKLHPEHVVSDQDHAKLRGLSSAEQTNSVVPEEEDFEVIAEDIEFNNHNIYK
jgi:cysteine-rich repeat protein